MRKDLLIASLCMTACLTSCSNLGSTEPVLTAQPVSSSPAQNNAFVAPAATPNYNRDNFSSKREYASIRADIDSIAEQQKMLTARMLGMEQELQRKDMQIRELQTLLDAMDKRLAEVDASWRNSTQELKGNLNREREARQREQKQFTQAVTNVIAGQNSGADSKYSEYSMLTVQSGDTLGKIAASAKISVSELMRVNNLKDSRIRVGQTLKVPIKK